MIKAMATIKANGGAASVWEHPKGLRVVLCSNGRVLTGIGPGAYHHDRSKDMAHDHVVFHMSSGAKISFNDPRRFGSMKLVPRAKLGEEPLLRSAWGRELRLP